MTTQPLRITPVYDLLLRGSAAVPMGLQQLHLATANQLCRLHYSSGSVKMVKARLKTLVDTGFIQADGIPTKLFRSPYYYCLTQKGVKYLEEIGASQDTTVRPGREINKHALFIEHTLELNDVLIAAALLNRVQPNYRLESFVHERALKRHPFKMHWKDTGTNHTFTLIPDAFLDFRMTLPDGRECRMPILLEHDRGTEGREHFKRRIRAYIMLLKTESYKEWFGVKAITIAFTTFVGSARLKQMRDWTQEELERTKELNILGRTFCFTLLQKTLDPRQIWLETRWFTPYPEDRQLSLLGN